MTSTVASEHLNRLTYNQPVWSFFWQLNLLKPTEVLEYKSSCMSRRSLWPSTESITQFSLRSFFTTFTLISSVAQRSVSSFFQLQCTPVSKIFCHPEVFKSLTVGVKLISFLAKSIWTLSSNSRTPTTLDSWQPEQTLTCTGTFKLRPVESYCDWDF